MVADLVELCVKLLSEDVLLLSLATFELADFVPERDVEVDLLPLFPSFIVADFERLFPLLELDAATPEMFLELLLPLPILVSVDLLCP